jgi:hypothetical protein
MTNACGASMLTFKHSSGSNKANESSLESEDIEEESMDLKDKTKEQVDASVTTFLETNL